MMERVKKLSALGNWIRKMNISTTCGALGVCAVKACWFSSRYLLSAVLLAFTCIFWFRLLTHLLAFTVSEETRSSECSCQDDEACMWPSGGQKSISFFSGFEMKNMMWPRVCGIHFQQVKVTLNDEDMDTFVFAVGTKKAMARMQKDMQDLVNIPGIVLVIFLFPYLLETILTVSTLFPFSLSSYRVNSVETSRSPVLNMGFQTPWLFLVRWAKSQMVWWITRSSLPTSKLTVR